MGNSGCNQSNQVTFVTAPVTQVTTPATIVDSTVSIVAIPTIIVGSGGIVTTLCATVGINSLSNSQFQILIFPNPTRDNIVLRSSVFGEKENLIVKVFDVMGKEILSQRLLSANTKLNTANLPQGIYFVKINSVVKKFVKE